MLNYHKTYRQSLDKFKRKATPKKQPTINRSHTSSINLKLVPDNQNVKASFKQTKQNHDPYFRKEYTIHSKSKSNINQKSDHNLNKQDNNINQRSDHNLNKQDININQKQDNQSTIPINNQNTQMKYSFKIKDVQDFYDIPNNSNPRLKTNYHQNSRPFQQTNRCLITDRNNSRGIEYKLFDRSKSKKNVNTNNNIIRTEYKQNYENEQQLNNKFKNLCVEQNQIKIKQKDLNVYNMKDTRLKDISTKHNTQSMSSNMHDSQKFVKISVSQLRRLYQKYAYYQNQVQVLSQQIKFYKKNMNQYSKNSIILTLK